MEPCDEYARWNLEEFRRAVRDGDEYTIPWLDLDVAAFSAYRAGERDRLPDPYGSDPVDSWMMSGVDGEEVLLLAGGGGQHSAVFSLLGARVTVLDLTPEQLEGDRKAAAHYGYPVTTIQGDMRDLSMLSGSHFARVYQPISTLFVPDLREVYRGVARVLKPGGRYFADYAFPLLYMAQPGQWNGEGYPLLVREPYRSGPIFETPDGVVNFTRGPFIGEHHHLFSDIINGLVAEGLRIAGLWENPRPNASLPVDLVPGTVEHRNRYLPFGISVLAEALQ
jgi:SAM-dependent methyltransferase